MDAQPARLAQLAAEVLAQLGAWTDTWRRAEGENAGRGGGGRTLGVVDALDGGYTNTAVTTPPAAGASTGESRSLGEFRVDGGGGGADGAGMSAGATAASRLFDDSDDDGSGDDDGDTLFGGGGAGVSHGSVCAALSPGTTVGAHPKAVAAVWAAEDQAPASAAKPRTMMGLGPAMGGLNMGELKKRISLVGSAPLLPPEAAAAMGAEGSGDEDGDGVGAGGAGFTGEREEAIGAGGVGVVVVPMMTPQPEASPGASKPAWMLELAAKKRAKSMAEAATPGGGVF